MDVEKGPKPRLRRFDVEDVAHVRCSQAVRFVLVICAGHVSWCREPAEHLCIGCGICDKHHYSLLFKINELPGKGTPSDA